MAESSEARDDALDLQDVRVLRPQMRSRTRPVTRPRYVSVCADRIGAMLNLLSEQSKETIDRHVSVTTTEWCVTLGRSFDAAGLTEMPEHEGSSKLDPLNEELAALLLLVADETIEMRVHFVVLLARAARTRGITLTELLEMEAMAEGALREERAIAERFLHIARLAHQVIVRRHGRRLSAKASEVAVVDRVDARALVAGGMLLQVRSTR
jgi:hypothetical protein